MRRLIFAAAVALFAPAHADWREDLEKDRPYLEALYLDLHQNPELSLMEARTAARMADELRQLGFDVTENVGGHGVVGVMENGSGPTVLLRADMDGLPVAEKTGKPYASVATGLNHLGETQPIMHACGHDVHMTSWVGAARRLSAARDQWRGTLVMIAQPAEELGLGAKAMLDDGLYERFPTPDYAVALHVSASAPAGVIGYTSGFALANVDSVDITVQGVGGHGAAPESTKDPVVIGAQIVMALQTLISRETAANDAAVVTVGSFHAGFKHNVISDEATMQLTVRSYSDESRRRLLDGIRRIAQAQAMSAGVPEERLPIVTVAKHYTPATYNDPELAARLGEVFKNRFGPERVLETPAVLAGEDFGRFGRTEEDVPAFIFWLGGVEPNRYKTAQERGAILPSLHSPLFAPAIQPTLSMGADAMTAAAMDLLASD